MFQKIGSSWNGTGATVYVCLGFIPDAVVLTDLELTTNATLVWDKNMLSTAEMSGGMIYTAADVAGDELTSTEGVMPYVGGVTLTSSDVGTTTYGEGVYFIRDDNDYRYYNANTNGTGDAVAEDITTWTLGSTANKTGNFNEDVNGTYIGEGSEIWIMSNAGKMYRTKILALTAGQGEAANEVTLAYPVPSGTVRFIGGMYGFKPMIAGQVTKDGFVCQYAFTDGDKVGFTAERWN